MLINLDIKDRIWRGVCVAGEHNNTSPNKMAIHILDYNCEKYFKEKTQVEKEKDEDRCEDKLSFPY